MAADPRRRSVRMGWAAGLSAAACLLGCAADVGLEVRIAAEPSVPAFERVRLELAHEDGVGVWERRLAGPGVLVIDPGTEHAGVLRVWGLAGGAESPSVVAYGEALRDERSDRVDVTLAPAGDRDGDWWPDERDNCPDRYNPRQLDREVGADGRPVGDGIGDVCDVCPDAIDPGQLDADSDGIGDACETHVCGDGLREGTEECDDGNLERGDGCSPACRIEGPGNGVVDPGEGCDDGNTRDGDDCDSDMQHAPVFVTLAERANSVPRLVELDDGRMFVLWTSAIDPDDRAPGEVALRPVDPATGQPGPEARFGRGRSVVPFSLFPGPEAGGFGVLWRDMLEEAGPPVVQHARILGARTVGASSAPGETVVIDDYVESSVAAWGTLGPGPGAAAVFSERAGDTSRGNWIESGSWPPSLGEDVASRNHTGAGSVAGAHRSRGGRLIAWSGAPSDRPEPSVALWVRRFDETGATADPEDTWVGDAAGADEVVAVYEPVADVYLVAALRESRSSPWFRIPPTGGSPQGPNPGAVLPAAASYLVPGDGTVAALWMHREGSDCALLAWHLDGYGVALEPGPKTTALAGTMGLEGCAGSATLLRDGRVAVVWVWTVAGTDEFAVWFVPSIAPLLPP
jgi:cysteine-rich repeat protein